MNFIMIMDYMEKYDRVVVVRDQGKTPYINCFKEYPLTSGIDIQKIIDGLNYGDITFEKDKMIVRKRINNK